VRHLQPVEESMMRAPVSAAALGAEGTRGKGVVFDSAAWVVAEPKLDNFVHVNARLTNLLSVVDDSLLREIVIEGLNVARDSAEAQAAGDPDERRNRGAVCSRMSMRSPARIRAFRWSIPTKIPAKASIRRRWMPEILASKTLQPKGRIGSGTRRCRASIRATTWIKGPSPRC
jgi:hypothetical protein